MRKSLFDISLDITEPEYRQRPELSYSTLSRFQREGFNKLRSLHDSIETDSLLFGSCVDTIITGGKNGWDDFNNHYIVMDTTCPDSVRRIVKELYSIYGKDYRELTSIPEDKVMAIIINNNYQPRWKEATRYKNVMEGAGYYNGLFNAEGKTIIDEKMYHDVCNSVRALKESESTRWYFDDYDTNPDIERLYQLKFAANLEGVGYRCMADLIIVNHAEKHIILTDLKTSSHYENEFFKSFIDWNYACQARLYSRIIKDNCAKDDYFKDFTFSNYNFIVVNKQTLLPLVWEFKDTHTYGDLFYGSNRTVKFSDPFEIGAELNDYLIMQPQYPFGISIDEPNDIIDWINKTY